MRNTRSRKQARKRQRRPRAEWVVEVRRWRRSGQSTAEYAAAHDLDKGTLAWWGTQLRQEAKAAPSRKRAARAAFLAVQVRDSAGPTLPVAEPIAPVSGGLEVVLANGRCVRVVGDFDATRVGRLIEIAEGGARC